MHAISRVASSKGRDGLGEEHPSRCVKAALALIKAVGRERWPEVKNVWVKMLNTAECKVNVHVYMFMYACMLCLCMHVCYVYVCIHVIMFMHACMCTCWKRVINVCVRMHVFIHICS